MDIQNYDKTEISRNFQIASLIARERYKHMEDLIEGRYLGDTNRDTLLNAVRAYDGARKDLLDRSVNFMAVGAYKDDNSDFQLNDNLANHAKPIDDWIEIEFAIRQGRDATPQERAQIYKTLHMAIEDRQLFQYANIHIENLLPSRLPIEFHNSENILDYLVEGEPISLFKVARINQYIDQYSYVNDGKRHFRSVTEQDDLIESYRNFSDVLKESPENFFSDPFNREFLFDYSFETKYNIPDFHLLEVDLKTTAGWQAARAELLSRLEAELKLSDERLLTPRPDMSREFESDAISGNVSVEQPVRQSGSRAEVPDHLVHESHASFDAGPSNSKRARHDASHDLEPEAQRQRTASPVISSSDTDLTQPPSDHEFAGEVTSANKSGGNLYDDRKRVRGERAPL